MSFRMSSGYAAALALCLWVRPVVAQNSDDSTLLRRIAPSRLAIPLPSTELVAGYPAVTVDKRVIQQMLRNRAFEQLDRYFNDLQAQVRQRIQLEYEWVDATLAFDTADSTLGQPLDEWIATAPASAHARAARAFWNLARAWHRRGTRYARETSDAAMRQMGAYARQSAADAVAAIQLDSTQFMAYSGLINVLLLSGDQERARAVFEQSRKFYPASYYLVNQYMRVLQPRWGGSFEEMAALASEVVADSGLNPRLVTILGAVESEKAAIAENGDDLAEAVAHANAALQYGPEFYHLLQRGEARLTFGDFDRGITDINAVLAVRPQYPTALELHAYAAKASAYYEVGAAREAALNQAKGDYTLLLSIDPLNQEALEGRRYVITLLRICPRDAQLCPDARDESLPTPAEQHAMRRQLLIILGIATLLGSWGIVKWIRGGFWLPRYIHLMAGLALAFVCFIDVVWVRAGGSMTTARWIVIPIFPLVVYFLFIALGGAVWASRK